MRFHPKKLSQQVIVITGASSGIGLALARSAARRGARTVLAGRNAATLERLADELRTQGGRAVAVQADVAQPSDVANIAETAIRHFGQFDTWVNNAGVSIFGNIDGIPMEDYRRLFDTNFWGVVHGSLEAVKHLEARGGCLINIGSEVSDRAIPLQGMYSASKHAVKGFTDALRMELEARKAPISVTLVKPASIATAFTRNAGNYMDVEPTLPPPVYSPQAVADAILFAAEHPRRDIYVGSASRAIAAGAHYMPRLMDRIMEAMLLRQQRSSRPARHNDSGALYQPGLQLEESPPMDRTVRRRSFYTLATTSVRPALWLAAGTLLAYGALHRRRAGRS